VWHKCISSLYLKMDFCAGLHLFKVRIGMSVQDDTSEVGIKHPCMTEAEIK